MKIVGIDEVGRGPLAGPVSVAVVVCEAALYKKLCRDKQLPPLGKDSKKISPEGREVYARYLKKLAQEHAGFSYAVLSASAAQIDHFGIAVVIRKLVLRGIGELGVDFCDDIRLDGGLKLPTEYRHRTIVRGDEREQVIAWASILAKVSRDAYMVRVAKKYPKYSFDVHKGYGTHAHRMAIQRNGLSPLHRKTFCKRFSAYI